MPADAGFTASAGMGVFPFAGSRHRSHLHRGLTLLEVLIAIALLLVTAALVYPAFDARFRQTQFEESVRRIEMMLNLARVEAQRTGTTIAVTWSPRTRSVEAIPWQLLAESVNPEDAAWFEDGGDAGFPADETQGGFGEFGTRSGQTTTGRSNGDAPGGAPTGSDRDLAPDFEGGGEPAADAGLLLGSWAIFQVPEALQTTAGASGPSEPASGVGPGSEALSFGGVSDAEMFDASPFDDEFDTSFGDDGTALVETDAPIVIAVYLADGSAILTLPLRLQSRDRDLAVIEVNAWTGLPIVTRSRLPAEATLDGMPDEPFEADGQAGNLGDDRGPGTSFDNGGGRGAANLPLTGG